MKDRIRRATALGMTTIVLVGLVAFALVGAGGIVAWEYSNSNHFCATNCHSVHPEEIRAHADSSHARVNCVECHMGRLSTLHLMALKPTHIKELWGMIVGYERPLNAHALRPSRDHCENCHWPAQVHRDSIAVKKRYATDADSSETSYRLALHTGFGAVRDKQSRGIHWHIDNDVQFVSLDPQRREIPWIQVTDKSGKVTVYTDPTQKAALEAMAKDPKKYAARRMECYDCHNQSGHPLANPADLVDQAMAEGRIDRALPNAKARAVALIAQAEKITASEKEIGARIDQLIAAAAPKDLTPEQKALDARFTAEMRRILVRTSFSHEGFSWKSFPNHAGHKDDPGCFRCHDGKHLSDQGESVRLQCTLCHELPQVAREKGKGSVASVVMAGLTPPDSHNAANFMHDHRFSFDDSCKMCHGKTLEFGREGGNFCSNPACHGRKWPAVNLAVKK